MFQPEPEITSSKCENISRTQTTSNSASFFIGFSGRVELEFDSTARYFPLKVWKKIWNWKVRMKVSSLESFVWTRTRQFREPTREFLAELSNIFPLQSEQMCKIRTKSNKNNFSSNFASGHVKCSSEGPDYFLYWMSKLLLLKLLKKLKLIVYSKKKISPEVVHLDAVVAVLTSLLKIIGRNPKKFVHSEKTISRIKTLEVKTTFLSCSSGKVDHFLTSLPDVCRSKSKQKTKMKVFGENHFLESVSLEGNKSFFTNDPGKNW